jgi:hypothetical protein
MRLFRLLCSALIGASILAAQTNLVPSESDDRYSVTVVRSALEFLTAAPGTGGTPDMKRYLYPLFPLGDRVSIAALKIYTPTELAKPGTAEAYLTAVRNAFSSPDVVREKSDKDSMVTVFVLEYLREKETSDPGIENRIEYLKGCVKDFKCSSQGEYAFFHKS